MKGFIVFSNKVAGSLLMKNFELINVRPDYKYRNKKVYIFKDSEKLREEIENYIR